MVAAAGTPLLSDLMNSGGLVGHPLYVGIVVLVLVAAFTKSAQFPFHFWLPNAMQAPTPVSAYLHSATMVKAGVYLVARMTPILGGAPIWTGTITVIATLTMVLGAIRALLETDLKRVLAYSTISALGILMLLFGMGSPQAVTCWLGLSARACLLQRGFVPCGGSSGARDRHARRGVTGRTAPNDAADRGRGRAGRRVDGRHLPLFSVSSRRSSSTKASACRRFPASGAASSSRWPWGRACASARPDSSPALRRFVAVR